ncbi:hypothetical protein NT2_06_01430 [Caenibius tardaugens NBRC 16725]|uniref:Uncharacterized protein n=1 Tax=Caenibius tardaugens NBRC 16725 TaxID=1219035 RepID=U3A4M4_9SPHN|nr:hypothetical protein [Caenibius tardaugens]AZI37739.1 hypothetical protein EGO55_18680 [Caenibius tardaugens NBRC 16725]GAD49703.1 hypothetical protein NT2_06_01430 [Caenibius tardaugens NBRC 16725]
MKQICSPLRSMPLLAIIAFCQGCANGPAFRGPIQFSANTEIVIVRATARRKTDGILVGGDVRRTNGYAGPVPGHLHVVGLDNSGNVVAITDAPWGAFMSRRFRLAYFMAYLRAANSASITKITIEPVTPPTR